MKKNRSVLLGVSFFASLAFALCSLTGEAGATPCDSEPTDMAIAYGEQITCGISPGADTDLYRFSGNTGDRILAEAVWVSGSNFNPRIKLIAPNGTVLGDIWYPARLDLVLPQTGTYTALISDDGADYVGEYVLTVSCTAGGCLPPPPPCPEQDADGDGEIDATDACPNTPPAQAVDSAGCSWAQFCAAFNATTATGGRICKKADWRNDEPLMKASQEDCVVDRGVSGLADDLCVPR